jgi:hypothetical protein
MRIFKLISRTDFQTQTENFDLYEWTKTHGYRQLGIQISTWELTIEPAPELAPEAGVYVASLGGAKPGEPCETDQPGPVVYACYGMTTRNGTTYGASQSNQYFRSAAERSKYIERRKRETRKRYEKQFGLKTAAQISEQERLLSARGVI